jgi:hypothetical protein
MVVYTCKKCGELNYLTNHAFWNIADFGAKCEKGEALNTIALENGELQKQVLYGFLLLKSFYLCFLNSSGWNMDIEYAYARG